MLASLGVVYELKASLSLVGATRNPAIFFAFPFLSLEEFIMAKRRPLKKLVQRVARNVKKRRAKRVARRKARRTA